MAHWHLSEEGASVDQVVVRAGPGGTLLVVMVATLKCPGDECDAYYVVQRRAPDGRMLNVWRSIEPPFHTGLSGMRVQAAADAQGNVYVSVDASVTPATGCFRGCVYSEIEKRSSSGQPLTKWENSGMFPPALAVGGRGNVFVSYRDTIRKLSPDGKQLASWRPLRSTIMYVPNFAGLALDRAGDIYASDSAGNRIVKLSGAGRLLRQWGAGGSETGRFLFPNGVAVDPHDHIWVMDTGNQRVQELSPDGRPLSCLPAWDRPCVLRVGSRWMGAAISMSQSRYPHAPPTEVAGS